MMLENIPGDVFYMLIKLDLENFVVSDTWKKTL
jgi:hypothetical protein